MMSGRSTAELHHALSFKREHVVTLQYTLFHHKKGEETKKETNKEKRKKERKKENERKKEKEKTERNIQLRIKTKPLHYMTCFLHFRDNQHDVSVKEVVTGRDFQEPDGTELWPDYINMISLILFYFKK